MLPAFEPANTSTREKPKAAADSTKGMTAVKRNLLSFGEATITFGPSLAARFRRALYELLSLTNWLPLLFLLLCRSGRRPSTPLTTESARG